MPELSMTICLKMRNASRRRQSHFVCLKGIDMIERGFDRIFRELKGFVL